jgi:putative pyruvate formate lyase activating enzyme
MNISRRDFIRKALLWGSAIVWEVPLLRAAGTSLPDPWPAYSQLHRNGVLEERIKQAYAQFEACGLCPRRCGADRASGEKGFCGATAKLKVYAAQPHYGEEASLVGRHGSGTIFFSNCNLRCVFCQNWPIAIKGYGREIEEDGLAEMMLRLQALGCHNINLVTPTHVMPNILKALQQACNKGLHIPLVYNTSGYERLEMLKLLDGIVDIYLPDMKYMDAAKAAAYSSSANDYPGIAQKAILEMHRQVGIHQTDAKGVARRGLMIRHLVMPNQVAGTKAFTNWVSANLPSSTYVNIMAQYHVEYKAFEYPEINRRITVEEYLDAMAWAQAAGLDNLDPDAVRTRNIYLRQ